MGARSPSPTPVLPRAPYSDCHTGGPLAVPTTPRWTDPDAPTGKHALPHAPSDDGQQSRRTATCIDVTRSSDTVSHSVSINCTRGQGEDMRLLLLRLWGWFSRHKYQTAFIVVAFTVMTILSWVVWQSGFGSSSLGVGYELGAFRPLVILGWVTLFLSLARARYKRPARTKLYNEVLWRLVASKEEYCLILRPFGSDGEIVLPPAAGRRGRRGIPAGPPTGLRSPGSVRGLRGLGGRRRLVQGPSLGPRASRAGPAGEVLPGTP